MVRPDDETITAETSLLRSLRCQGWWIWENDRLRATSLAFFDGNSGETSCYLDTAASRALLTSRFPKCPAARFTGEQARGCGFNLTRDPDEDPDNSPDHVVLTFAQPEARRKVYQGACKKLAVQCEVVSESLLKETPPSGSPG
jgi:hypothetical protein